MMPAQASLAAGGLPIGLAHNLLLKQPVASGQPIRWTDVEFNAANETIRFRREMEQVFRAESNSPALKRAS
jgi:predicted homoserine dehydrogenase-like protein